jgi:Protein of unknown function (DUF2510)
VRRRAELSSGPRFPIVKGTRAYDIAAVDAFFDGISNATRQQVRDVRFPTVWPAQGYVTDPVDEALCAREQELLTAERELFAAAWYADPLARHELRYWDGRSWTDHVSDAGVVGLDPTSFLAAQRLYSEPTKRPHNGREMITFTLLGERRFRSAWLLWPWLALSFAAIVWMASKGWTD